MEENTVVVSLKCFTQTWSIGEARSLPAKGNLPILKTNVNGEGFALRGWTYSRILFSRTSKGNKNWFEKSGVREIEGGVKSL